MVRRAASALLLLLLTSLILRSAGVASAQATPPNDAVAAATVVSGLPAEYTATTTAATATLTPTPSPCSPRPPVTVTTRPGGAGAAGTLLVTVGVTRTALNPSNSLLQLQFGPARNGVVELAGVARPVGGFTVTLPTGTGQVAFTVRRQVAGQPMTVPFTVVDGCGPWQSFVGGGTSTP